MDQIATGALFYHRDALRANLSRGGQAIALTGPGRLSSCSAEEALILEKIGIDTQKKCIPQSIAAMAAKIGKFYSARGVQILGHDYIVDDQQNWYFLEINTAFGLAVFNVTHGDGAPSHNRGFRYAGPVLEKTMQRALGKMKMPIREKAGSGRLIPGILKQLSPWQRSKEISKYFFLLITGRTEFDFYRSLIFKKGKF